MWGGYKYTYEKYFYHRLETGKHIGSTKGFPMQRHPWCQQLKVGYGATITEANLRKSILPSASDGKEERKDKRLSTDKRELVHKRIENEGDIKFSKSSESEVVQYLGIASDEPERIERHKDRKGILLPLVEIGWTEAMAKQWCIDNNLLSPIYTDKCMRGGCWFCHNQGVEQLRELRHNYPDLWALLLKWDLDSPVTFHADGHTVHDFDRRFEAEDNGFVNPDDRFRWSDLDNLKYNIFHYLDKQ